ncbi:daptomycin-sensing surface protein LiaX [Vagococcus xieshaowenii]|uniref:Adhesin domain-containing protein n=1 Tax=Vagococcus xieshaowenii TaxID=2562451 RepID=A0AAJ5JQW0_9ENTE|nr:daptomycin-sensing surface protein LiaX [Vagococcus xieshaowenii]QCA28407.1 hypothetical protein E4Z98_03430 [Vagococcus xieshaowenii]TFZ42837.1 hypothetical protein E4031_02310 [Vagococcus xieshaowenii]
MKERERILELVKKGIITSEEALILLENLAMEKDEQLIDEVAKLLEEEKHATSVDESVVSTQKEVEEHIQDSEAIDQERLEKILDQLVTQANEASVKLDNLTIEIETIEQQLKAKNEQLVVINTLEDLEELDQEKITERRQLEIDLTQLRQELAVKELLKEDLEQELKAIKKDRQAYTKEQWSERFEIPEHWEKHVDEISQKLMESADKLGDKGEKIGRKLGDKGIKLGHLIKSTVSSVYSKVNDNMEWKDINMKVPGVVSNTFTHEFNFDNISASVIDVKVANGSVEFKTWDSPNLKVDASIKLYGKFETADLFDAFMERSQILVDEEKIKFYVPNKRVKADLVFYLPKKVYDYLSVNLLNGPLTINELDLKDAFVKSTNGDMTLTKFFATMLEVKGVNGDVTIKESSILDFISENINGDYILQADIQNTNISSVNGEVKLTAKASTIKKVEVNLVNGTIKVALPAANSVALYAKTSTGSIKNRLTNMETIRERIEKTNQYIELRRITSEPTVDVQLNTTTGTIYLKDTFED